MVMLVNTDVPGDLYSSDEEDEQAVKDQRITGNIKCNKERMSDKRRVPKNELEDSEDEGDGRRNRHSYKERSLMSYDKEKPMEVDEEEEEEEEEDDEQDGEFKK
jgi:hypothetical protein